MPDDVPTEVYRAVTTAFYSRLVASSDQARSRAQIAYTIASAFAGGLIGTAVITGLPSVDLGFQIAGAAAVLSWLVAAALYVHTVSMGVPRAPRNPDSPDQFVRDVVGVVEGERRTIDRRQGRANVLAFLAALLTAGTVFGGIISSSREFHGTVLIDASQSTITQAPCGKWQLTGNIQGSSLRTDYVIMTTDPTACGGKSEEVRIPRTKVVGIVR